MYEAERGLFDLRRGRFLYVTAPDGAAPDRAALLATVEGLSDDTLDGVRRLGRGPVRLAVTHHRARAMGLTVDRPRGMSLSLNGEDPDQILRLSSAIGSCRKTGELREASAPEMAGLTLARLGGLLPAVVSNTVDPAEAPELRSLLESRAVLAATTTQIEAMAADVRVELTYVSEGPVPLEEAEDARILCFRETNGLLEHVAIVIGKRESWPDPVPVRLHSACLTGDLFGRKGARSRRRQLDGKRDAVKTAANRSQRGGTRALRCRLPGAGRGAHRGARSADRLGPHDRALR